MMNRTVYFSWFYNRPDLPLEADKKSSNGTSLCGWTELIRLLAIHTGIYNQPVSNNKRILAYTKELEALPEGSFFAGIMKQDPLIASDFLLRQRDDLKWYVKDFSSLEGISDRLSNFALAEKKISLPDIRGISDIYQELCDLLAEKPVLEMTINLMEDDALYPSYVNRLLDLLPACGVSIERATDPVPSAREGTNLHLFQEQLLSLLKDKAPASTPFNKNDNSLLLYQSRYMTDAAHELHAFLKEEGREKWYLFRQTSDLQLAEALLSLEGRTAEVDSRVATLPVIQILQSLCNMIWKPLDVEAVYEFLNLPIKPFPGQLADKLATALLQAPGVNSSVWRKSLEDYWLALPSGTDEEKQRIDKEKERYAWWFEQELYNPEQGISLQAFARKTAWIGEWAKRHAVKEPDTLQKGLYTELSSLCTEISDLAAILAREGAITRIDLDKLLNLLFANRTFKTRLYGAGTCGIDHDIAAFHETRQVIWWDFSRAWESSETPDYLWRDEAAKLEAMGCRIFRKEDAARLLRHATARKVLAVSDRLVLSWSEFHGTSYNYPHSFWLWLMNLPESCRAKDLITNVLCASAYENAGKVTLKRPGSVLTAEGLDALLPRERESYSSINSMVYYPHLYLLRDVLDLRDRLRGSFTLDATMKGSIIHKFAETALNDRELMTGRVSRQRWTAWCDNAVPSFIDREAALLNKSSYAIDRAVLKFWMYEMLFNLIEGITAGGWQVESSELPFEKPFFDNIVISGRTDLVLRHNGRRLVVDLKSGSSGYREKEITGNADWQLLLYSCYGHEGSELADSAFFIILNGLLLGRHNPGIGHFREVNPKPGEEMTYAAMRDMLKSAMRLRIDQLKNGEVEFRTDKDTIESLPSDVAGIKMKEDADLFDEFRFLNNI